VSKVTERLILITGGAGFIGYHLARRLSKEQGNKIVLLDNFERGRLDKDLEELLNPKNVRIVSGDIAEEKTYARLDRFYDEIYHLAAVIGVANVMKRPHDVLRTNALGTLLLLDWFTRGGGEKLLFASTSEVYAWTQKFHDLTVPTPEDVPLSLTDPGNPRSAYAGSKIFGELAVHQYCAVSGKRFSIVRYHNVYGPRMGYEHAIPQLYQRALDGQNPLVVYSADHTRAFCYVSDAVEGTVRVMRNDSADNLTINIGNDLEEMTIGELARRLLAAAKIEADIEPEENSNDPIIRRCPDINLARKLINYEPKVPINEGLQLTIDWYSRSLKA